MSPSNAATKPGWTTSEFWSTITTSVVTMIALFGAWFSLPSEDTETLSKSVSVIIGAIGAIAFNGAVVWKFIASRQAIKVETIRAEASKVEASKVDTLNITKEQKQG